jgi:PD-(D/E)XK nuclease superfamily
MKIPDGPNGFPTLSASQFRTYGTGGFLLEFNEEPKGCPRKYHAKYVDRVDLPQEFSYPLVYGGLFHQVMFLMDEKGLTPEEAAEEAFDPSMPQEMWTELRADLENYMARGASPSDRFAVMEVEAELTALLYEDEEFGPVYYRGFLDWIGVDMDFQTVIHLIDYKTNRAPARREDLLGDVQLRGYHWLALQNADRFVQVPNPRVVTHLDVVKFNDVEVAYSASDIEDWHSWAVAMARKILRDEEHLPVLNTMCSSCPIRFDCPAFDAMPEHGAELVTELTGLHDPLKRLEWRDRANRVRLNLDKSVKAIDSEFKSAALTAPVFVGGDVFKKEADYSTVVDLPRLQELLGTEFWKIAGTSKTAVEALVKDWEPSRRALVLACFRREMTGEKVVRRAVEEAR